MEFHLTGFTRFFNLDLDHRQDLGSSGNLFDLNLDQHQEPRRLDGTCSGTFCRLVTLSVIMIEKKSFRIPRLFHKQVLFCIFAT